MAEVDLRRVDDAGQIEGAVLLLQVFGETAEPFTLLCVECLVLKHAAYFRCGRHREDRRIDWL